MMSNKNLSIIFTGQGSQFSDMGADFAENFSWVKDRYNISSEILGYDVFHTQRDPKLINLTQYSQPLIFILSSIIIDICRDILIKSSSKITLAGHSLGEYCALYFAKALNFEQMLELVKLRGESMSIVSDPNKFAMYAILKKEDQIIDNTLFGNGVYVANLNSNKQIVVCGLKEKLEKFKDKNPIGKYIPLNVSAPFHSELMLESSKLFLQKTTNIKFNKVDIDIISNHHLKNYKNLQINDYINQLSLQIHNPIMWSDTMSKIINFGVDSFIEIGPKKTLLNFISKDLVLEKKSISNIHDIEKYVQ